MVEAEIPRPVQRDLEGLDDVGVQPVCVVRGIVPELGEHHALEGIPAALQQALPQGFRLLLQLEDVVIGDERVLHSQSRDVLRPDLPRLVQRLGIDLLRLDAHKRPGIHKHLFHPAMADVARVAGRPDNRHNSQGLFSSQTGLDEIVDHLLERGQLVKVQELNFNTAVLEPVSFILAVPEKNLAAVHQPELMPPGIVDRDTFRI